MTIYILKFLEALALPPMSPIILITWGLLSKHRGRQKIIVGLALLILCSMPIGALLLYRSLEAPYSAITLDSIAKKETAIVLGGYVTESLDSNGEINMTDAIDRLYKGKQVLDQAKAQRLLLTGGNVYQQGQRRSEAIVAREVLINWGANPDQILIEPNSLTTMQNAQRCFEILDGGDKEVLLITSAAHMGRALWAFRRVGFDPIAVPADKSDFPRGEDLWHWRNFMPSAVALKAVTFAVHEWLGRIMYRIIY